MEKDSRDILTPYDTPPQPPHRRMQSAIGRMIRKGNRQGGQSGLTPGEARQKVKETQARLKTPEGQEAMREAAERGTPVADRLAEASRAGEYPSHESLD